MGKTAEHFLLAFFDLCFAMILLINFFGWINALEGVSIEGFESFGNWGMHIVDGEHRLYYFGFQSFFDMLDFANTFMDNDTFAMFKLNNLTNYFYGLFNFVLGGLPSLITDVVNMLKGDMSFDLLRLLSEILTCIASPFVLIGYSFLIVLCFLWYALGAISTFICALGGMFNTYTINPMTPSDYLSSLSAMISI